MTTIEERAKIAFPRLEDPADVLTRHGYIEGAIEQDRIARQEERERCIKAAQEAHCKLCGKDADYKCYCLNCLQRTEIRKALEGGEG